jgi:putative addiction module killer protein
MPKKELIIYQTAEGNEPFSEWFKRLKDATTRARIRSRLDRVEQGNYGDYKSLGEGVYELRFFFGPGYRIYFGEDGDTTVLLLCGGDKTGQRRDIVQAQAYWQDYLASKEIAK